MPYEEGQSSTNDRSFCESSAASITIDHTGLEMGSERFERLLRSVYAGLVQQIPIMGPVIHSILADQSQADLEARLRKQIEELSQSKSPSEQTQPNLVPALLLVEAEVKQGLAQDANPKKRFLYLAGKKYASFERTFDIAVEYGFLWRKYYNTANNPNSKVLEISEGDVIALGYRVRGNRFRILLPLVVTKSSDFTCTVDWTAADAKVDGKKEPRKEERNSGPFVQANDELSTVLLQANYKPDPCAEKFVGLAVKPLFVDVERPKTVAVLQTAFPSPGQSAIWAHDYESPKTKVPYEVRDWIAKLPHQTQPEPVETQPQ